MYNRFFRVAAMPRTVPLATAPPLSVPLAEPPRIEWISAGRHGRHAREDYRLPELWCLHLYRWTGALLVNEVAFPVSPGYVSIVAPDSPLSHFFRTQDPPAVHLTCGFRLAAPGAGANVLLPVMSDTGESFGTIHAAYEKAIGVFGATPRRAEAIVWDILWRLAESANSIGSANAAPRSEPLAVTRTREAIELRLAESLRVESLAHCAGLSHNHLTRLFHAATGKTVVAYIRERRMERAMRLLRHTTIPIKQVAAQVGLPDLHQFNKAIRAATGVSPRSVRGVNRDGNG